MSYFDAKQEEQKPYQGGDGLIDPRQGLATHQITDADSCKHDSNNNEHKSLFFEWQRYRYYLKRKKYPNKIIYLFVDTISLTSENTFLKSEEQNCNRSFFLFVFLEKVFKFALTML